MPYFVTTTYHFLPLVPSALSDLKTQLESFAKNTPLRGLCLIGSEGVNLTVSGPSNLIAEFKIWLASVLDRKLEFKDGVAERKPFQVFKVKVRDEIVTMGRPDLVPPLKNHHHLSPREWQEALKDPDTLVLDTRNRFEVELGQFKSAVDLNLKEFSEFPRAIQDAGIAKDKKVLLYCTGGIRCEKAILEMHEQGFQNVHQLRGGILNYLKEYPEDEFAGECFVFDYRVAVDQNLQPTTRYDLCAHCGQPSPEFLNCAQCGTACAMCKDCANLGANTCSKNCRHHQAIGSKSSKPQLRARDLTSKCAD